MSTPYLRWDGYRVKHQGEASQGRFVAFGWLCAKDRNQDSDRKVRIFFEPGKGYTYQVMP